MKTNSKIKILNENEVEIEGMVFVKKSSVKAKLLKEYTDIDSFEDALLIVESSHTKLGDLLIKEHEVICKAFPETISEEPIPGNYHNAVAKMRIVIFAANGCDESFPSDNSNERKYSPYFYRNKAGVGFSFGTAYYADAGASVGSRLEFKNEEMCKYFAEHKNFKMLYKIVFNQ